MPTERRRWTRRPVRPEKTYSDLDPFQLQAAVNEAERINRGPINSPAISAAIKKYLELEKAAQPPAHFWAMKTANALRGVLPDKLYSSLHRWGYGR